MAMLNWQGWAANFLGWGSTGEAPPVVTPTVTTGGVGRRKRRVPHFVEIDGKLYEVDDHEHAVEILTRLHEEAKKKAPAVVKKAVAEKRAPEPPKVVVAPARETPRTVNFVQRLQAQVAEANQRLAEEYHRAAIAEMAMRRYAEEMAEEDDIETLIALGIL